MARRLATDCSLTRLDCRPLPILLLLLLSVPSLQGEEGDEKEYGDPDHNLEKDLLLLILGRNMRILIRTRITIYKRAKITNNRLYFNSAKLSNPFLHSSYCINVKQYHTSAGRGGSESGSGCLDQYHNQDQE